MKRARDDEAGESGGSEASGGEESDGEDAGRVFGAFAGFERSERSLIEHAQQKVSKIAPRLLQLLPKGALDERFGALTACAQANADFVAAALQFAQDTGMVGVADDASSGEEGDGAGEPPASGDAFEAETDELRAVLHSLVREWSSEGAAERAQVFAALVDELRLRLPPSAGGGALKVLVPGSGLGRLPAELCAAGYSVEASEMSLQMLLVSAFVMNCTCIAEHATEATATQPSCQPYKVHPFIHQRGNHSSSEDQLRAVAIPDKSPGDLIGSSPFSTVPGDFLKNYSADDEAGAWDALVSCFFIDTAPCVLEYIEAFHRLLKPGGLWLNLGPLLFHWAHPDADEDASDERFARSLELPWSSVREAIIAKGFEIVKEEWRDTTYTENTRSMMQTQYKCIFFVAIKRS